MKRLIFIFLLIPVIAYSAQLNSNQLREDYATKAYVNTTTEIALTSKYDKSTGDSLENQFNTTKTNLSDNYSTTTQMNTAIASATAEVQYKYWYPANMANGDFTGEVAIMNMAASCDVYNLLYMTSSGMNKAQGDTYAHTPVIGMCIETGTGNRKVLLRGLIKNTSWNFTVGSRLYLSASTAGLLTATAPSTAGNQLQLIAIAVASDTIYFCPNSTVVEL